jgi:3-oxoadipate enol-lactonase
MRIQTRTIATNYELSGPEKAPVVMLSHSLGSSLSMWNPQMAALEPHFRVLRYDTRGHGASDAPTGAYTLDQLVEDARALLDALKIERVHFVGLSMGGMIGQGLALAQPGRLLSLSLCSTSAFIPEQAQPVIQERIDTARKEGLQALVDGTLARWFTPGYLKKNPPEAQLIRRQVLATPVAGYIGCTEAIRKLNYMDQLSRIKLPTLIMVGEDDPGTPVSASKAIHERIAGSKLVIIPKMLHLHNVENSALFNANLLESLGVVFPAACGVDLRSERIHPQKS